MHPSVRAAESDAVAFLQLCERLYGGDRDAIEGGRHLPNGASYFAIVLAVEAAPKFEKRGPPFGAHQLPGIASHFKMKNADMALEFAAPLIIRFAHGARLSC